MSTVTEYLSVYLVRRQWLSGKHAITKVEDGQLGRQQTRKTPTRDRKRVGYLQISYQYHLSPRSHLGFPCGRVDHGLRRCCHGTSCKMKADYTRSMYLSQPGEDNIINTTFVAYLAHTSKINSVC
jgi:hypothetical protein